MKRAAFCELAFGRNAEAASWLHDEERVLVHEPFSSVLVRDGDNVRGVVLFFNRCGNDIEMGFFGRGLLSRRLIKFIGTYCFVDNGCSRITARTRADNTKAIETLQRCGFALEGRQRGYFDDTDALIFGLLKKESKLWVLAGSE